MLYRILQILFLVLIFNACVPLPLPSIRDYPELSGKIIDSTTDKAIENVSIKVLGLSNKAAKSKTDGTFIIDGLWEWDFFGCIPLAPVGLGFDQYRYKIQLSHPNYTTITDDITFRYHFLGWNFCGNGSIKSISEFNDLIKMQPKQ